MTQSARFSPNISRLPAQRMDEGPLPKLSTRAGGAVQPRLFSSGFEQLAPAVGGLSWAAFAGGAPAIASGLGIAAAVGGVSQFAAGAQEWQQGRLADGAVDMASGGLNVLGGTAMATGVGAPLAPVLFGSSSVLDGGRDFAQGLNSQNGEKTVVGAAKMAGGGMMIAGGAMTATGNPALGTNLTIAGAVTAGAAALLDIFV